MASKMIHTPPATRANSDRLKQKLKEEVKNYRRLLQKLSKIKTKILWRASRRGLQASSQPPANSWERRRLKEVRDVCRMFDLGIARTLQELP